MNNRSPMIAGGFAALTMLLASPPEAEANFKRQHASSCIEDSLVPLALFQDQFLINTSDTYFDFFFCGMPEDTALRKRYAFMMLFSRGIASTAMRSAIEITRIISIKLKPRARR